jgi:ATP-dependent helicase/nuclease subunit A
MKVKSNQFVDALRAARVPVHSDSGTGFFDSMEINDMRALLRVLDNQQQDIALAAVLRSPLAGLENPDDSLARIRLAYPDGKIAFHEAVSRYAAEQKDPLATRLSSLFTTLNGWRTLVRQRPLAEVLWHVYNATGYMAFCSGLDG